jgi:hypothetical protein
MTESAAPVTLANPETETEKRTRTNAMKPLMPLIYENVIGPQIKQAIGTLTQAEKELSFKNIHAQFCKDVGGNETPASIPESAFREWFNHLGYKIESKPVLNLPK